MRIRTTVAMQVSMEEHTMQPVDTMEAELTMQQEAELTMQQEAELTMQQEVELTMQQEEER
jgi:hypothetical protein